MADEPTTPKPIMVLPTGALSAEDLQRLRDNGVCCVEAEDPDAIRFVDPPVDLSVVDRSAGHLFRTLLEKTDRSETWSVRSLGDYLARIIAQKIPTPIEPAKKIKRK